MEPMVADESSCIYSVMNVMYCMSVAPSIQITRGAVSDVCVSRHSPAVVVTPEGERQSTTATDSPTQPRGQPRTVFPSPQVPPKSAKKRSSGLSL